RPARRAPGIGTLRRSASAASLAAAVRPVARHGVNGMLPRYARRKRRSGLSGRFVVFASPAAALRQAQRAATA
ncbi:hypothetical protein, partial [Burkholderia glumae]|uniref:hypothetical protein n=1 Tax=Burkholderia glumae TaxID=337 RepID=UPI0005B7F894